jgi:cytochrome o ubiquinol oxidase subunit 2
MTGMQTELNLIANQPGEFKGLSANLSGEGFADMKFVASAVKESEFNDWVVSNQGQNPSFNQSTYDELAKPSYNVPDATYDLGDPQLFANTIHKYMGHGSMNNAEGDKY